MNCNGTRSGLSIALRIKNVRSFNHEGYSIMFGLSVDHARELLEVLKVLIPDHGQVMPPGVYYPLLWCDKCGKATRHLFSRTENRIFKATSEPENLSDQERRERESMNAMILFIYKCPCGNERGWGNSGV